MISNKETKVILDAIINKKTLEVPSNINDVVEVFKSQSLVHQLYKVYNDTRLKKYYLSANIIYEQQNQMIEDIKRIFNENKIDFVLLKGSVIRNLYPSYFLRLQGDIDVLVRENDLSKASELLCNNQYTKGHEWFHHIEFEKNNIILELHHSLFKKDAKWYDYFANPWEHVLNKNQHEYMFEEKYFVMYEIAHLAKHMSGDGAGLRPFIDFYYIFNVNSDLESIKKEAESIGLDKFLNSIFNVINYFFGLNKTKFNPLETLDDYITIIIQSGTHGHSKNSNYYANRMAAKNQSKFKFYMSSLFPSRSIMKKNYPYLNKYPILFPYARICRICRCIFIKSKDVKKINSSQDSVQIYAKVFDEIGIRGE